MQIGTIFLDARFVNIELPLPTCEVTPGVQWGSIEEFPSPAYWAYQVFARRISGRTLNYKLGSTLREEVGACLLGGHGIPAEVGLAAFHRLRDRGIFNTAAPSELTIFEMLSEPLSVRDRLIKYRFARQKSTYLAAALSKIDDATIPVDSGKELRDWLVSLPGIGFKTASWIARNWLSADDVAILDIHILRAGILGGFLDRNLSVERHYLKLEEQFLLFSVGLGVRASELDAVMWLEMMSSPLAVRRTLESSGSDIRINSTKRRQNGSDISKTNTGQAPLFI